MNDPYPGRCHEYVDANADGVCDLSQSTLEGASGAAGGTADNGASEDPTGSGCPLAPCAVCGICDAFG